MSEREKLHAAVGTVLVNAFNYPARVQTRMLVQDMFPLTHLTQTVVDSVLSSDWLKEHDAAIIASVMKGVNRGIELGVKEFYEE